LGTVERLLQGGADIEARTKERHETPLHLAVQKNHFPMVNFLVERGANIEAKTNEGWTPLHLAAEKGHKDVVECLIMNGADKEAKIKGKNETPLYLAVQKGNLQVGKILIEKGANTESRAFNNETLLHWAVKKGILETVKFLIEKGAEKEAKTENGLTPLYLAVQNEKFDIFKFLINKGCNIEKSQINNLKILHFAVKNGDFKIVEYLVGKGASIETKDTYGGNTPLHVAAEKGHLEIVDFLIKKGANKEAKAKEDFTPLHLASQKNNPDIVKFLIEKGANKESTTSNGFTPLHLAANCNQPKIVDFLLKKGANKEAETKEGETPLHLASQNSKLAIIKFLIEKGENKEAKTKEGFLPLHLASQKNNLDIVKFLIENGANKESMTSNGFTPLHLAAKCNQLKIVDFLLEKGANKEAETNEGETPLHLAAEWDQLKIVDFLIERGANKEAETKEGKTPLHLASQKNNLDVVKFLIEKGVNKDAKTKKDFTSFQLACQKGHLEIFEFLFEKRADLLAVTKTGGSVFHLASQNGHPSIIRSFKKFTKKEERPQEDACGKYPIHYAAENGFAEVVKCLVETMEYDVNQLSKEGKTALQYALAKIKVDKQSTNHLEVVQVLLQHSASATPADKDKLKKIQNEVIQKLLQGTQLIHPNLQSKIVSGEFDAKIAIKNTFDFNPVWSQKETVIFCQSKSPVLEGPKQSTNTVEGLPGSYNATSNESLNVLKEFENWKKLEKLEELEKLERQERLGNWNKSKLNTHSELSKLQLKVFCNVPFQESNDALYNGFGKKDLPWPKHKHAGNLTLIVQSKSIILLDEFHKQDDLEDHFRKLEAAKKIISDLLQIAFDYVIPSDAILKKLCFSEDDFIGMFKEAGTKSYKRTSDFVDDEKLSAIKEKVKKENVEILMLIGLKHSRDLSPRSFWHNFHEQKQRKSVGTSESQLGHHELKGSYQLRSLYDFLCDNLEAQKMRNKDLAKFQRNVIAGIVSLYFQSDFEIALKTKQQAELSGRMEMESGNTFVTIIP
jgi:ankyrin repeat protein